MIITVEIDPGLEGALAVVERDGMTATVLDTPTIEHGRGARVRRDYDIVGMIVALRSLPKDAVVVLERLGPTTADGVIGNFMNGRGMSIWETAVLAADLRLLRVTPQVWKRKFGLLGQPKDASRGEASRWFPHVDLRLKKHHNRSDALLLARWGQVSGMLAEEEVA